MKPVIVALVLFGAALYAVTNVMLKGDLTKVPGIVTVFLMAVGGVIVSGLIILAMWMSGQLEIPPALPEGISQYWWLLAIIAGLFFVGGDWMCVLAYNRKASVATVTILLMGIPVFATLFEFLWRREAPTKHDIVAAILMAVAVLVIASRPEKE